MPSRQCDVSRLSLLVQRLADADLLGAVQAELLLAEAEAARRCSSHGDLNATRQHVERIALFTRALVKTDGLTMADGRAVIQTAERILDQAG